MIIIDRRIRTGSRVAVSLIKMVDGAKAGRRPAAAIGMGTRNDSRWNNTWMASVKCRDVNPALFFPSDGSGVRAAQRICAVCPMKLPCLEYALDNRIDGGVWGGTSERERRRILHQR